MKPIPGKVLLAASQGGHLEEMEPAGRLVEAHQRVWVTQAGPRARALREQGERVVLLPDSARSARGQTRLWRAGLGVGLRERPEVVITSGPGMAVPVCLGARVRGARILFVETLARVTTQSTTGRILAPLSHATFLQWPEQERHYPGGRLCRPGAFEAIAAAAPPAPGEGTFVTVGTHQAPFHRLLAMVRDALARGVLPRPAVVQSGAAGRLELPGATVEPFLTAGEADAAMRRASYVVCHGGIGSIAGALRAGRRPLVLSRSRRHREHFDDHQAEIVEKLAALDLVVRLDGGIDRAALDAADRAIAPLPSSLGPSLMDALASALDEIAAANGRARRSARRP